MRVCFLLVCSVALLSACTPATTHDAMVVHEVPHMHGVDRSEVLKQPDRFWVSKHTVRSIRPDATGYFPGDYAAAWNAKPAYEAAHIGGGTDARWRDKPSSSGSKYDAPVGKYGAHGGKHRAPQQAMVSSGLDAVSGRRPVPGHSAYEAHRVYRPPMDCAIVSRFDPEPWVGERYICVER
jgi:hypothetical protein